MRIIVQVAYKINAFIYVALVAKSLNSCFP